eukprot:462973_1
MALISSKDHICHNLLSMRFDPNYIRRAFKVYESSYGHSGYTIDVITELILRLQNKDEQKLTKITNKKKKKKKIPKLKLVPSASAPISNKKKSHSVVRCISIINEADERKIDIRNPFDDIPRSVMHKHVLNEQRKGRNPWSQIIESNEEYLPQWVQCNDCKKWRILLVKSANIIQWKPPTHWKCNVNLPFNRCLLPQQTDTYLTQKYSNTQLSALDIQRINLIKRKTKELLRGPNQAAKGHRHRKRNASDLNRKIQELTKETDELKLQNEELDKRLCLYQGISEEVDTLNLKQLVMLESRLQHGIKIIKEAKDRLLENQLLCMVCLKHQKSIVIQDCGHFDLCSHCVQNLPSKKCPRCQNSFQNVIAVNH